jgi:hypothetical protein
MEIVMFHSNWYAKYINQTLKAHPNASPDAAIQADAMMTAGAFIAEAVQLAIEGQRDDASLCDRLEQIEGAIDRFAEAATTQAEVSRDR